MRLVFAWLLVATLSATCLAEPLASWRDGEAKSSIISFVETVTTPGRDFVPPAERVAVFDNDGCLWPENPLPFQLHFALDELKRMAPDYPEWSENATISAALAGDVAALKAGGKKALLELISTTHSGLTTEEFTERVRNWFETARHPRFNRRYNDLAYQPMLEVLEYLRKNDFKTYIVSGGGADFMRVFAEETYGIPPEQVIGSIGPASFKLRGGKPVITKDPGVAFIDDKAGKPVGIHRQIGRHPIAAFGNSDGDLQMLQWTTIGCQPSFGLIVHHTDAEREYAYDANPKSSGKLVEALKQAPSRGWTVVDMQRDWKVIFSPKR